MRFEVVTLFPELFPPVLATSIVGRAISSGALAVHLENLREYGVGRHRSVDDTPYGGGAGMVMRVDCLVNCLEALEQAQRASTQQPPTAEPPRAHRVLLCPQGAPLRQRTVVALASHPRVVLVCGRYEGFDDRVREFVDEEVSLGDFVMTGGEIAAMAIIDACARLLPGVLGNAESTEHESHSHALGGLLEYPQYTRPSEFRGRVVPEVLAGGNHAVIDAWRRGQAEQRTRERRPDLWETYVSERNRAKEPS